MYEHNTCMQAGYTVYCIILFADVSEPDICNAGDWDEQVTERQQNAHEETSSDDETSNSQIEVFPDSHKTQPAEVEPDGEENGRFCPERQESSSSVEGGKSQELVLHAPLNLRQESLRIKQQMQMQKILGAVFNPKQLIDTYLRFRQLLGNDVRRSHEAWEHLQATNDHPLLKVAALAFGVISTPETSSYMEQQWDQLQEHMAMGQDRPDAIVARAMMDYARAWAYHREDMGKAYNIVYAFYKEMQDGDSSNFFLAPCYTVTIGRWIYEANHHRLTNKVIKKVKYYAYKTLRQLRRLEDEWAIIDTFGTKLNATLLLVQVKKYYSDKSHSAENLEQDIECLLRELECSLLCPKVTTYDKAGFYSVRKLHENKEEFCRCAKISAELFRQNGRIQRAKEEAELSGDTELMQQLLKEAQNIP